MKKLSSCVRTACASLNLISLLENCHFWIPGFIEDKIFILGEVCFILYIDPSLESNFQMPGKEESHWDRSINIVGKTLSYWCLDNFYFPHFHRMNYFCRYKNDSCSTIFGPVSPSYRKTIKVMQKSLKIVDITKSQF